MFGGVIGNLLIGGIAIVAGIFVMEDYTGHGSLVHTLGGAALILAGLYYSINAVISSGD